MRRAKKIAVWSTVLLLLALAGARAARYARIERALAQLEQTLGKMRAAQKEAAAAAAHAGHGHTAAPSSGMDAPAGHVHMDAHMRWTSSRPQSEADRARAAQLVEALRRELPQYTDYRAAAAAGYEPFLPHVPLPMYHFTHYGRGLQNAFGFDPERPTSLLYKTTADGRLELAGAMYTAPRAFTEDQLNQRVPLSVARWHQHVNICLPQPGQNATADWTRFGPAGSIATEKACAEAGGRWHPVLFGWMVHAHPFESETERIWPH
jgi:hypothetical protein